MGRIYESQEDFERAWEADFRHKVDLLNQDNSEKVTCDGEWTEETLRDDIYDEVKRLLVDEGLSSKYKNRALKNPNLLIVDVMYEEIISRLDLISAYNSAYNFYKKHDKDCNGIYYFDDKIHEVIRYLLEDNLVTTDA